jgi:hypothetical protein
MVYIVLMLIKSFSDYSCPVNEGIVILWGYSHGSQNNSLHSIFIYDGMLIAELTQEPHLCGILAFLIYSRVFIILAVTCTMKNGKVSNINGMNMTHAVTFQCDIANKKGEKCLYWTS